jgi:hypothetical protein
MNDDDPLGSLLHDTHDLETFLHELIPALMARRPEPGEDVTRYVEEFGLRLPAALHGSSITWAGEPGSETEEAQEQTLVLVRPGVSGAIGFTIGCIRVRRVLICLECGWLYCRIVIRGRF